MNHIFNLLQRVLSKIWHLASLHPNVKVTVPKHQIQNINFSKKLFIFFCKQFFQLWKPLKYLVELLLYLKSINLLHPSFYWYKVKDTLQFGTYIRCVFTSPVRLTELAPRQIQSLSCDVRLLSVGPLLKRRFPIK